MGVGTKARQQPLLAGGTGLRGPHEIQLSGHRGDSLAYVPLLAVFLVPVRLPPPGLPRHLVFESLSQGQLPTSLKPSREKKEKAGHWGPRHWIAWTDVV